MKKSIFTLFVLFISIGLVAQKGGPEKSAKKTADKMTEVLSLNEADAKKVYDIQLAKYKKVQIVKKENADNKEKLKAEVKKVSKGTQSELVALLGKDKMEAWRAYLKSNKKKKK